jgi:hypothetical protein
MATPLNQNTVYSSSFITDGDAHVNSEIFILHEQFMLATKSGVSGLWDIYDVKVTNAPEIDKEPVYHFTRAKKALDIQETFNHLAAYEKDKQAKGYVQSEGFAYKNATAYKDAATAHGLIQDIDTGKYGYLVNAAIPEEGGSFTQSDLEAVTTQMAQNYEAAANKEEQNRLIDQILKPHLPSHVNIDHIIDAVQFNQTLSIIHLALNACNKYLQRIISNKGGVTIEEGYLERNITIVSEFDVIRKRNEYSSYDINHLDESLSKAFNELKTQIGKLNLKDAPEFADYLEDVVLAVEISEAIIMTQFKMKKELSPTKELNEKEVRSQFSSFQKRFRKKLSEGQLAAAERAFLDYNNIKVPESLLKAERTLEAIAQDAKRQTNSFINESISKANPTPPKSDILSKSRRLYY